MTSQEIGYKEFWFEDETEFDLYQALVDLNYELDPNA
jgi:hypothetical protein